MADGTPIAARDLHLGDIVSRPEWADGAPVRVLGCVVGLGQMRVRWQPVGALSPAASELIDPAAELRLLASRHDGER